MTPRKSNAKVTAAVISQGSKSSKMIADAMKKYFDKVDHIDVREIEVNLGEKTELFYRGEPLPEYDCVYPRGSFKYADMLMAVADSLFNKCFVPVKASSFTYGHDKLLTQIRLTRDKIPMPTTYLSSSAEAAKKTLEKINYPIIMKLPKGTHGKGVMFADSFASASSMLDALDALKQPFLVQEYVETGGVDTRAIVVGDKVVASMKRKAVDNEKRANIHAGGTGECCELDAHTKKIAIKAAKASGAYICAVDILEGVKGPVVIEINLSPGLQGITKTTNIDVADKIAKYLFENAKKLKDAAKEKGAKDVLSDLGIMDEENAAKEIITNLDFRGERILLPDFASDISEFNDKDELVIKVEKGKISIKKM